MNIEIIAELAQGFEGKPEQTRLLMKAAAAAGADAAKFQLVFADELATPDYRHYRLFASLEMDDRVWVLLSRYAQELGIKLYLDIFGTRSLRLAEEMGISAVKLHGTDIANLGFLQQVANSSISRVLLGTGGAHAGEIERAIDVLSTKEIVLLLGFQGYPTPNEANQIDRVRVLTDYVKKKNSDVRIGFADHAAPESHMGYALAATAIGAGATVIEKHLTLGRGMQLEDYESALNPDEFTEFCRIVRGCAEALGVAEWSETFGMSDAERQYRNSIRRHVVTTRALAAGARLSPADLALKRTGASEVVSDPNDAYGRVLKCALADNAPLKASDLD